MFQVDGVFSDYTFTDLELHDGSYYDVKIISCNGAKLCSESLIGNVLVDSSPPTSGMILIMRVFNLPVCLLLVICERDIELH